MFDDPLLLVAEPVFELPVLRLTAGVDVRVGSDGLAAGCEVRAGVDGLTAG